MKNGVLVLNAEGRMDLNQIFNINCLDGLKQIPDNSIDCCVTSPPYYALRNYGHEQQIGMEETPDEYVTKIVEVFTEVKRALKPDGTLWLNLGDSYAGSWGNYSPHSNAPLEGWSEERYDRRAYDDRTWRPLNSKTLPGLKKKDIIGIPWMVAFALRSSGWYLRQDIIWNKPNPMPESVTDRCTKSHEYIFLLSKSSKYYFDQEAIKTDVAKESVKRLAQNIENQKGSDRVPGKNNGNMKAVVGNFGGKKGREHKVDSDDPNFRNGHEQFGRPYYAELKANKKTVWTVSTKPFKEAHFATFPEDLIVDCIKAGCPNDGVVLDPFMGAGTTALVARKLNRNFIGFELNPDYISIANKRLHDELGFFL